MSVSIVKLTALSTTILILISASCATLVINDFGLALRDSGYWRTDYLTPFVAIASGMGAFILPLCALLFSKVNPQQQAIDWRRLRAVFWQILPIVAFVIGVLVLAGIVVMVVNVTMTN